MGYTTEFRGVIIPDKPITGDVKEFINKLNETRRMKRNLEGYGVEGEFFVGGSGYYGQNNEDNVIDNNKPPSTQPGLWCQWHVNNEGEIEWDGGEKFFMLVLLLVLQSFPRLVPFGKVL